MSDYLVHFNKNHDPKTGRFDFSNGKTDSISKGDRKPFSYDYYDYTKDHIERVKQPKSIFVKEIYTDKNGNIHELKLLESKSKRHMKKKYGSERSLISLYAKNKFEDAQIHNNASIAAGISAGFDFVNSAMAFSVGSIAVGGALAGVGATHAAKSFVEEQLAKKISSGLMNMSINEIKELKKSNKVMAI